MSIAERLERGLLDGSVQRGGAGCLAVLGTVATIAACAWLLAGCGAGAIGTHARAATATAGVIAATGTIADEAREAALDRVEREHPTDPEHDEALLAEAARWRPVGLSLDAARSALLTWIAALTAAQAAGEGDSLLLSLLPVAARVALLYESTIALLGALGVEGAPGLPDGLRALVLSVGGER